MRKLSVVLWVSLFAGVSLMALLSCGSSLTPAGSSISIAITEPATDANVSPATSIVATITDNDSSGLTVPSSWSDVFDLHIVGSTTNLCTDGRITYDSTAAPQTVTCSPAEILVDGSQYAVSISGLTDLAGARIDPATLLFETGAL